MPTAAQRIVLVTDPRAARIDPAVRRYRMARLKLADRRARPAPALAHLRRVGD